MRSRLREFRLHRVDDHPIDVGQIDPVEIDRARLDSYLAGTPAVPPETAQTAAEALVQNHLRQANAEPMLRLVDSSALLSRYWFSGMTDE